MLGVGGPLGGRGCGILIEWLPPFIVTSSAEYRLALRSEKLSGRWPYDSISWCSRGARRYRAGSTTVTSREEQSRRSRRKCLR